MFGLMRRAPRLPYCGTCKTIGVRYGQASRMALNHDIVFLAELLMRAAGEPQWSREFRSYNCLARPKEIPEILDYAAAITIVLAHFRVADHCDDTGRWHWPAISRALSPAYRKAASKLRGWEFPLDQLAALLETQRARERRAASLADVAEPTAAATAMVFRHGARFGGDAARLERIGRDFGYLIYVLDAFEDRENDARSGSFNALAAFPAVDGRAEILRIAADIDLPADLKLRLQTNVEERLGMRLRVLCCVSRQTLRQ